VLNFQLSDFLTGNTTLHARYRYAARLRNWRIALLAGEAGRRSHSAARVIDMALAFCLLALLNTIDYVSH
jgi:hypothetical protein